MAIKQNLNDLENDPEKIGTRYTVRTPHPDFDPDDPNPNKMIKNEYGHTNYPKWIEHPTKTEVHIWETYINKDTRVTNRKETNIPLKVLVNNEDEEKAILEGKEPKEAKTKAKGWTK